MLVKTAVKPSPPTEASCYPDNLELMSSSLQGNEVVSCFSQETPLYPFYFL